MLSAELRQELAAIAPASRCDRLAEISGLFHTAGSITLRGRGEVSVHLDVASSAVVRRAFAILRALGVESEIRTYPQRAFARETRYQLHVPGIPAALDVLAESGVLVDRSLAPLETPPARVVAQRCCRAAYLRGALLGAGSLSRGHLEVRFASVEGARFLASLVEGLAVHERGRHAIAYAKGTSAIEDVLAAAGAGGTVLALEERAVIGGTRARANRLANADHANLVRTSRAAHLQLRAIRSLDLGALPAELRDVADLRLRYPAASLRELAARTDPPATKAAVHRRLRRIVELAGLE